MFPTHKVSINSCHPLIVLIRMQFCISWYIWKIHFCIFRTCWNKRNFTNIFTAALNWSAIGPNLGGSVENWIFLCMWSIWNGYESIILYCTYVLYNSGTNATLGTISQTSILITRKNIIQMCGDPYLFLWHQFAKSQVWLCHQSTGVAQA